ncbi:MAG TPA: tetratricopeptide repeat protein [Thermoanaerobaculia bacterium]|nr:tetratricopeptide repeat protein [Thermoanaerobaculia bacterium]
MHRSVVFPALALLALPALAGCQRLQARVELKKGNALYAQEQYSQALKYFQKGLELDPADTFAWRSVGLTALALYRPGDDSPKNISYGQTAIKGFENYLAENPEDTKVQDYLLSTYVNTKQYDKANAYVTKLEQAHPENKAKYDKIRGNVLIQAGKLDEATNLALSMLRQEQPEALYTIAVAAWAKVYNNALIDAATRAKLVDLGLNDIQKAVELKPDYYDAMFYYGLLLREKSKLETDGNARLADINKAQEWLQKGLDLRKKAQPPAPPAKGK